MKLDIRTLSASLVAGFVSWYLCAGIYNKNADSMWTPLLVALFYLPVYQCTELGYFDTAKHTSGVGEGAAPKDPGSFDSGWGGF